MKTTTENGSHAVALALLVVVLGVIGFAGYRVWQMQSTPTSDSSQTVSVPAKITNKATLDQAASALDASSTELNANLDASALNADISSLL